MSRASFEFATVPRIVVGLGTSADVPAMTAGLGTRVLVCTGGHPERHQKLLDALSLPFTVVPVSAEPTVDAARSAGALGARMTGGGFGGSAIALVPTGKIDAVIEAVLTAFAAAGFTAPVPRLVGPAQGARRDR